MHSRTSPWPLLAATCLLLWAGTRAASYHFDPPQEQSHISIGDIPEDRDGRLQQALKHVQKGKQLKELFHRLKDEKLFRDLRNKIPADIWEKLQKGEIPDEVSERDSLLNVVKNSKQLSEGDRKLLEELVKEPPRAASSGSASPAPGSQPSSSSGSPKPAPPPENRPNPATFDQTQKNFWEGLKDQVMSGARDAIDHLDSIEGGSSARGLRDTIRRLKSMDLSDAPSRFSVANRVGDLSRFTPRLNELLTNRPDFSEVTSLFRNAHLPERPRLSGALPTGSGRSLSKVASGILWLFIPVVLVLLAWTYRARARQLAAVTGPVWRLGPWPVRPNAVSTRDELIRAFEYLAFLYLGPEARTCNHREVAEVLAEQPDAAPERRRDAAWNLAQLYEEARYAPSERALSADEWRNVRRDLCLLAGVPSA